MKIRIRFVSTERMTDFISNKALLRVMWCSHRSGVNGWQYFVQWTSSEICLSVCNKWNFESWSAKDSSLDVCAKIILEQLPERLGMTTGENTIVQPSASLYKASNFISNDSIIIIISWIILVCKTVICVHSRNRCSGFGSNSLRHVLFVSLSMTADMLSAGRIEKQTRLGLLLSLVIFQTLTPMVLVYGWLPNRVAISPLDVFPFFAKANHRVRCSRLVY